MKKDLIEKIKSRGYWRINFQPVIDEKKFKSLSECKNVVEKSVVKLRGWDYPHFPRESDDDSGLEPGENFYRGWIDWGRYKEFWHMYQSGQFLHYIAIRDDWLEEDDWLGGMAKKIKPLSSLGVIGGIIYQMTEVFEFLLRLVNAGVYDEGVNISVSLNNTENRELRIDSDHRAPLFYPHKTGAKKIEFLEQCTKEQILKNSRDLSLKLIIDILEHFAWDDPPIETIKKDQENLLTGRL